ncbi:MoaD/ThiS family protein [Thermosulfuriphilus sp.]
MKVKLRFFGLLRLDLQKEELSLLLPEGASVRMALEKAAQILGPDLKNRLLEGTGPRRGTIILINGKNILYIKGLDTELKEKDKIDLFPPGAGG